jgi:ubiquinone/menaquinone biosynthesis C-methylase UbiE
MNALQAADTPVSEIEYRPFPNVVRRNVTQERLEVPAVVRVMGIPSGGRILEIGCGRGIALPVFSHLCRPTRLVGLDIEAALLAEADARAREKGVSVELIQGDVRDLPFADLSFDVVIDFGTCFHIARPQAALREIARVLAPGGLFVTETPLSQLLSHPIRAFGRTLPWRDAPALGRERQRGLWSSHRKLAADEVRLGRLVLVT